MNWTDAQQAVIDSKDQSLLVTAAAGSGKTAVLVERIIEKLIDKDDPWDIDELLVVTFTNAAAREMKERIYKALNKEIEKDRTNKRLTHVRDRVYSADIRTIDSFCKNVVSEYFSQIDLDPDFRLMDSGETELLKREVLEDMLSEEYESGTEAFLKVSDIFSKKGSDDALSDVILMLYNKAQAHAWPMHFYKSLDDAVVPVSADTVSDTAWMKRLTDWIGDFAKETLVTVQALLREAAVENADGTFDKLIENLSGDETFFTMIKDAADYDSIRSIADTYTFQGVGKQQIPRKATEEAKTLADGWKIRRDEYKVFFQKKIQDVFLNKDTAGIAEEENLKTGTLHEIIRLARKFDETFLAEKKDRKSFEFSDIEHFAVNILLEEDGTPKEAALNYRKRYREVMVDEYQDTNALNEMILGAVTRDYKNYFMVGDVKQSIYGFRNADPGIILKKSEEYGKDADSKYRRIDLDSNFRSRQEVVDTVNDIFRVIMIPEIGGVKYDEVAELKLGASYSKVPEGQDNRTETIVLLRDDADLQEIADDKISVEATWTAQRIIALMKDFKVSDGENGMRPLKYSDIAVILRSTKVNAARIMEVFASYGIPALNAADTGYFSAPEVVSTLNYLRLIDNPRQDIPMASVLTSMYVGLSEEDLAIISTTHSGESFYQAVLHEMEEGSIKAGLPADSRRRFDDFLSELTKLREMAVDTPVYELLDMLYTDTGYDLLVSCMPGGARRRENLMKLFDKAVSFSQTSFSGISAFISYIERIEKYNADEGEADAGGSSDAVQIMTIHKSKGLEFPVVFALGLGNSFQSDKSALQLSGDQDISMKLIDPDRHTVTDTLHYNMLRSLNADADLGEEMRVLYVALTRAKEKLFLVGSLTQKNLDSLVEKGKSIDTTISYSSLKTARSFYHMIIPALSKAGYVIDTPSADDFVETESDIVKTGEDIKKALLSESSEDIRKRAQEIADIQSHKYVFDSEMIPKQKYSVSEIKRAAIAGESDDDTTEQVYKTSHIKSQEMPLFMQEDNDRKSEDVSGAERGTAMHRFLEKLDFTRDDLTGSLEEQISEEIEKGFLTERQADILERGKLKTFLSSDLCRRMREAALRGDLFREQAFVTGDSYDLFFKDRTDASIDAPEDDQIIVQGIIDAFFIENGKIVLLDYKTDAVHTEKDLIEDKHYDVQLQIYQIAVERAMNMEISEMYLYSFALDATVPVPLTTHQV